jgi:hypothetical protein
MVIKGNRPNFRLKHALVILSFISCLSLFLCLSKVLLMVHTGNGIGKVYLRTGHEVPDME